MQNRQAEDSDFWPFELQEPHQAAPRTETVPARVPNRASHNLAIGVLTLVGSVGFGIGVGALYETAQDHAAQPVPAAAPPVTMAPQPSTHPAKTKAPQPHKTHVAAPLPATSSGIACETAPVCSSEAVPSSSVVPPSSETATVAPTPLAAPTSAIPAPAPPAPQPITTGLRLATFNVEGASHTATWRDRAKRSVNAIRSNDVGVIGFQELQPVQRDYFRHALGQYQFFPAGDNNDGHRIEDSIAWNNTKYALVDSGIQPGLHYFCNQSLDAPWVELEDRATHQRFYELNTHDPANAGPNACSSSDGSKDPAYERYSNAKQHVTFARQLAKTALPAHIPILFTCDCNGGYVKQAEGDNASAWRNKNKFLGYCVMSAGGFVDAYDAYKGRNYKCPNPRPQADVAYGGGGGIDHVYVYDPAAAVVAVTGWSQTASGENHNGSDHPLQLFSTTITAPA